MIDCSVNDPIMRDWIGSQARALRYRSHYDSSGSPVFAPPDTTQFASAFWNACNDWSDDLNVRANNDLPGSPGVDWFGHVGTYNCSRVTAAHNHARGFDLARVTWTSGLFCDMGGAWQGTRTQKRRYLGVAATIRCRLDTVLTAWFNSDHNDHIHVDNLDPLGPIDDQASSDTSLIQAACNLLISSGLVINGNWGSATEQAFDDLRNAIGMPPGSNIRGNLGDTKLFLGIVAACGFQDVSP